MTNFYRVTTPTSTGNLQCGNFSMMDYADAIDVFTACAEHIYVELRECSFANPRSDGVVIKHN